MIKLFRHIRQRLLNQSKTSQYLAYGIGEILLVVIGILIALGINNWNQTHENRKAEQQILAQLEKEYESNLQQLESKIYIREQVIESSFKILAYRKLPMAQVNADSFNLYLSRVITRPTFDPISGVTEELKSSGKLYLITNDQLRSEIAAFESFLSELHEEEQVTLNHVENIFIPFIIEHYQIGKVMAEFMDDDDFTANFTLATGKKYSGIGDLFDQVDFEPILHHPDFEDQAALMINNCIYTNQQSLGVKQKMDSTLAIIRAELKP